MSCFVSTDDSDWNDNYNDDITNKQHYQNQFAQYVLNSCLALDWQIGRKGYDCDCSLEEISNSRIDIVDSIEVYIETTAICPVEPISLYFKHLCPDLDAVIIQDVIYPFMCDLGKFIFEKMGIYFLLANRLFITDWNEEKTDSVLLQNAIKGIVNRLAGTMSAIYYNKILENFLTLNFSETVITYVYPEYQSMIVIHNEVYSDQDKTDVCHYLYQTGCVTACIVNLIFKYFREIKNGRLSFQINS